MDENERRVDQTPHYDLPKKGLKVHGDCGKHFTNATTAFVYLSKHPFVPLSKDSEEFATIEHYTCYLYSSMALCCKTNAVRQELFTSGKSTKLKQNLLLLQDSLLQHINRSIYQIKLQNKKDMQNSRSKNHTDSAQETSVDVLTLERKDIILKPDNSSVNVQEK
uniref:Uncharacterized protein n=1 Tax=Timema poppense TaxID=170557 RepID=A0A7R9D595_TIMPO|nr:unnamed protein product [Timema poppensis]